MVYFLMYFHVEKFLCKSGRSFWVQYIFLLLLSGSMFPLESKNYSQKFYKIIKCGKLKNFFGKHVRNKYHPSKMKPKDLRKISSTIFINCHYHSLSCLDNITVTYCTILSYFHFASFYFTIRECPRHFSKEVNSAIKFLKFSLKCCMIIIPKLSHTSLSLIKC